MKTPGDCLQFMQIGIDRVAGRVPAMPREDVLLARMLMLSGNAAMREMENLLRPHGLNESEFRTLAILFSSPDGSAFPSELCQFTTQKPTNMTRIINGLVQRGLVTRMPGEQDRRRVILRITREGRRFTRELLPLLFAPVRQLMTGFTPREKRELHRLLTKFVHNIDRLLDAPETAP